MTLDIDATYRDGAIHPNTPLNLPNNTPVHVRVETKPPTNDAVLPPSRDLRPKSSVLPSQNMQ
jgi:hypothetical protein